MVPIAILNVSIIPEILLSCCWDWDWIFLCYNYIMYISKLVMSFWLA